MRRWWLALPFFLAVAAQAQFSPSTPEGNAGITYLEIRFTSPGGSNFTITGDYQTVDGTATAADNDYVPTSGTFVIPAGDTTSTVVRIGIVGDTKFEANETFQLVVSNVQGGTINNPGPYTFTIVNDDTFALSASNASVTEGNGSVTPMTFTVTLNAPAGTSVQAAYATAGGTATAGVDFTPAQGVLTFAPGETTRTVTVGVIGDTEFEENETFTLTVTSAGASVTATGTILNDDERPPAAVTIVGGNNQTGRLGQRLAQPLVVRVINAAGEPVRGVTVLWTVTSGKATLEPAASTTDADGRASTNATVNSFGPITIQARAGTLAPVTFTVNAVTSFTSRAKGPVAVPIAMVLDAVCARNEQELDAVCRALSLLPDADFSPTLERLAPHQSAAQSKVAGEVVSRVTSGIAARLSAVRGGAGRFSTQQFQVAIGGHPLPLFALMPQDAPAEESDYSGWSAFVSGNLGTGERKPRDGQIGFDLDSQGLMFGADRLIGRGIVGASLNLMQLDAQLSAVNGAVDTNNVALSVYGSAGGFFSRTGGRFDGLHVDGSLTYGRNAYESERDVSIGGLTLARGSSDNGAGLFAVSAMTGFEAHADRTDFDVSIGGTYSRVEIDDLSEEGSGPLLLFVEGQNIESLTGNLALNVRSAFAVPFGTLLPSLRAELVHETEAGARLVTARFQRDRFENAFVVPLDQPDEGYGRIGAGLQAVFPYGWSASVEATQDVLRDDLKFRNVQFTVYKSF